MKWSKLGATFALSIICASSAVYAQQGPVTAVIAADSAVANAPATGVNVGTPGKLVGGGARVNWRIGNLLTQSSPGPTPNSWAVAAKDHLVADPSSVTSFGVVLYDPDDEWEVAVRAITSAASPRPVATATVPAGFVMTGGGCVVNWREAPGGAGSLLTSSIPVSNTTWECRSKDHGVANAPTITAYVMGIRPKRAGVPLPEQQITRAISAVGANPSAAAAVPVGFVLTGGGARALPADPNGPGQLLTASFPEALLGTATPAAWRAISKDHAYSSPGTVEAFAVNLRFPAGGLPVVAAPGVIQQSAQAQTGGNSAQNNVGFAGAVLASSPSSKSECQRSCSITSACSGYTWRGSGGEDRSLAINGGAPIDRTKLDPALPAVVGACTLYSGDVTSVAETGSISCRKPCGAAFAEVAPFPAAPRPGPIVISPLQPKPIGIVGTVRPPPVSMPQPPAPVAPAPVVRLSGYEIIAGYTGNAGPTGDVRIGAGCSPGRVATGGGFLTGNDTGALIRSAAPNINGGSYDVWVRNANVIGFVVSMTPYTICIDRPPGYAINKVDGDIQSRDRRTIEAACPAKRLVGGGAGTTDIAVHMGSDSPRADAAAWTGYLRNDIPAFGNSGIFASAACVDPGVVTEAEMVTSLEALVGARSDVYMQVNCPIGKKALSGGVSSDSTVAMTIDSIPLGDGSAWGARVFNPTYPWDGAPVVARLRAICARVN